MVERPVSGGRRSWLPTLHPLGTSCNLLQADPTWRICVGTYRGSDMEAVILASTPSSMDIINTMGAQPEAEPSLRGELGEVSEEVTPLASVHSSGE